MIKHADTMFSYSLKMKLVTSLVYLLFFISVDKN